MMARPMYLSELPDLSPIDIGALKKSLASDEFTNGTVKNPVLTMSDAKALMATYKPAFPSIGTAVEYAGYTNKKNNAYKSSPWIPPEDKVIPEEIIDDELWPEEPIKKKPIKKQRPPEPTPPPEPTRKRRIILD